ncbi:hypothetical protein FACS1894202_10370 [Clostridia bacterium]|nr:hypothetical protein FACS1894202_10370 [Clostridia bacterium]
MGSVRLYDYDALIAVSGLYATRALQKMKDDLDVYSALLDKFLNQMPRSIPLLRRFTRERNAADLLSEVKALRLDLADIFALDVLVRANQFYDAAEAGDMNKCANMIEPLINALQTVAYDIKQCRTQEGLENEDKAVQTAAKLDIGSSMINQKYASIPKAKFIDLYKRIDGGLADKALNLAKVLKAMNYESNLASHIEAVLGHLTNGSDRMALDASRRLLMLLGVPVPPSERTKFYLLVVDDTDLIRDINGIMDAEDTRVVQVRTIDETLKLASSPVRPDFIIVNKHSGGGDGMSILDLLVSRRVTNIPIGFATGSPSPQEIVTAKSKNVSEFFVLPLDIVSFREKMRKYRQLAGK